MLLRMMLIGFSDPKKELFIHSKGTPFMVALVPTGINTGVVTVTPLSVSSPTLAFQCLLRIVKSIFDIDYLSLQNLYYLFGAYVFSL